MSLPEKAYDRLHSLLKRWQLPPEDVYYAIENGLLRVCVWIPLRYMERDAIEGDKFMYVQHEHRKGFTRLRPEDFHRILSTGCAKLRIFQSIRQESHILRVAYEPPQSAISVHLHDLVVLRQDQLAFEQAYGISATSPQQKKMVQQEFSASADYHHLTLNGDEYHLGDVQAQIIEQLHDAAQSRNQWVHGKTLLRGANSKAMRLRDLFKSNESWEKLIVSNGRGYYRLNIAERPQAQTEAEAA